MRAPPAGKPVLITGASAAADANDDHDDDDEDEDGRSHSGDYQAGDGFSQTTNVKFPKCYMKQVLLNVFAPAPATVAPAPAQAAAAAAVAVVVVVVAVLTSTRRGAAHTAIELELCDLAITASICTVTFAAKGSLSFHAFRVHIRSPTSCIYRRDEKFPDSAAPQRQITQINPTVQGGLGVQLRPFSLRRLPAHRPEKRTQGPHADSRETIAALVAVRVYSI